MFTENLCKSITETEKKQVKKKTLKRIHIFSYYKYFLTTQIY